MRHIHTARVSNADRVLFTGSRKRIFTSVVPVKVLAIDYIVRRSNIHRDKGTDHSFRRSFKFLARTVVRRVTRRIIVHATVLFSTIGPRNNRVPIIVNTKNSKVLLRRTVKRTFRTSFVHGNADVFAGDLNRVVYGPLVGIISSNAVPFGHKTIGFSSRNMRKRGACLIARKQLASFLRSHVST